MMKKEVCPVCDLILEDETCPDCQCTCGNVIVDGDYGICVECDQPVCEECQAELKGPPNPIIDFPIHNNCLEGRL